MRIKNPDGSWQEIECPQCGSSRCFAGRSGRSLLVRMMMWDWPGRVEHRPWACRDCGHRWTSAAQSKESGI